MEEVVKRLEIESAIKGSIKDQRILLGFNWALLIISSLFVLSGVYALYQTTKRGSVIATIPIGIYLLVVFFMFVVNIFTSVVEIQALTKKKTKLTKLDWVSAIIPVLMSVLSFIVLGVEGYRLLCLNKSISKLSRPVAIFKLLISGTVIIQSGAMIWRLKNPFTSTPVKWRGS